MINVLINGSKGKMGEILKNAISKTNNMCVKYEIDKDTLLSFEKICNDKPDIIIDFSTPEGCMNALDYAVCHLIPVVVATTGFNDIQEKKIVEYSQAIPIFKSSNLSYSIYLISKILEYISPLLSMDIEILEKHHRLKKDSPSGTAILLADAINRACSNKYTYVYDRHSNITPRKSNEIGFSSIRGGSVIGEHSVIFLGENESIEIKHTSYSREIYAEGAILAAKFILKQKHGLYNMEDLKKDMVL